MSSIINKRILKLAAVLMLVAPTSCKKFLEVKVSPEIVDASMVFESDVTTLSAINGVYTRMRNLANDLTSNGASLFGGLLSDELYNTASNANYDPFATNSLLNSNETVSTSLWRNTYRNIYNINAIIEGISESRQLTPTSKIRFTAEARFLRAWHYFYLLNFFGDVPLILETNYQQNAVMPRTGKDSVYLQIIDDLKFAKDNLPTVYPSTGKARPNKWAAGLLLSRAYLYIGEWQLAVSESAAVIESKAYMLKTDLATVFLAGSEETVLSLAAPNEGNNSTFGVLFIPTSTTARPVLALRPSLVSQFASNDRRAVEWIKANINGGIRYAYPFKYRQRTVTTPIVEQNVLLRYAEAFLIRAEALANLDEVDAGKKDLDMIKNRAGLPGSMATVKSALLTEILQERRLELFSEWGHRWFDLKRSGTVDLVLSAEKGNLWQATDQLLPIPLLDLTYNIHLAQNPGY